MTAPVTQASQDANKIATLQADVAEVSTILQQNLNKLFDRGQNLDQLESQSGDSDILLIT